VRSSTSAILSSREPRALNGSSGYVECLLAITCPGDALGADIATICPCGYWGAEEMDAAVTRRFKSRASSRS
jgi:hypothetical protein